MKDNKTVPVCIRIDRKDYEALLSQALEENMKVSALCREIIVSRYPKLKGSLEKIEGIETKLDDIQKKLIYHDKGISEAIRVSVRSGVITNTLAESVLRGDVFKSYQVLLSKRLEAMKKEQAAGQK